MIVSHIRLVLLTCALVSGDVFNVLDYGAKHDGATINTNAIARTFAACAAASEASELIVLFPGGGIYLTSAWVIACNHSTVIIEAGATIKAVNTTFNWPLGPDCPEPSQGLTSHQAAPFIYLHYAVGVKVTGGGTLDFSGPVWWAEHCGNWWCPKWVKNSSAAHPYAWRPFMLRISHSQSIVLSNLTFKNPAFWCIVPTHSSHVTISSVTIDSGGQGPNTDGIEPMWSDHIHVRDVSIHNGDDCMTVKSGSSDILVEDMHCQGSHGITVGSLWYDDVRNVTYRRIAMEDCSAGPRIKGRRQGNATVTDVIFEDITLNQKVETGLEINMLYETPGSVHKNRGVQATNIVYRNVTGQSTSLAGTFQCVKGLPCDAIVLEKVHIASPRAWQCSQVNISASSVEPLVDQACEMRVIDQISNRDS